MAIPGVAVSLVHSGVGGQEVEVLSALQIPHVHSLRKKHHWFVDKVMRYDDVVIEQQCIVREKREFQLSKQHKERREECPRLTFIMLCRVV
jgi:hypothetical protein